MLKRRFMLDKYVKCAKNCIIGMKNAINIDKNHIYDVIWLYGTKFNQ
jgi:hypothetical protein